MKIIRRTFFKFCGAAAIGVAMGKLGLDLSSVRAYAVDLGKNLEQGGNKMSAKFTAYEYVPSGFEMVIENKEVKAWNLWWNVKELTDDPEAWDNEIRLINQMQGKLGELTVDQRLIRAQMAEFCRRYPLFPESIDILCKEIGEGRFSNPARIGCEGRGLLKMLGYHEAESVNEEQKEILKKYVGSLRTWLVQGRPENPTESKVFGILGQSTKAKETFVEKVLSGIDCEEPSILSLKKLSEHKCGETHGESAFAHRSPYPFCCLCCDAFDWSAPIPKCRCAYSMIIDAGLLCAGTFGEERSIFDESIRFTEENTLVYAFAINAWLNEVPSKPVTPLTTARYIPKDNALEIAERVHSSLGEKDEAKEWLVACLLKTIKDNQRGDDQRTELIDDFPEATSWFRKEHGIGP